MVITHIQAHGHGHASTPARGHNQHMTHEQRYRAAPTIPARLPCKHAPHCTGPMLTDIRPMCLSSLPTHHQPLRWQRRHLRLFCQRLCAKRPAAPRVAEVAQVIADGGRRPGPKARAEGARRRRHRKFWPFWTSLTHFPRKNSRPGGRLQRTALAGAFGALPRPGGRLRRSENQ